MSSLSIPKGNPQTIQIFLPHGDARGLRIAEITSRTIRAVQAPRSQLQTLFARREADQPACYFLFGESADGSVAYVGQTEDIKQRIGSHDDKKDFWTQAVVIVSSNQMFTQTHIRYLEWLAISRAKEAGRFSLDNGNGGSQPFVTESAKADILDAFETIGVLLATLGFPLFDPVLLAQAAENKGEQSVSQPKVRCSAPTLDVTATGEWAPEGFVLHFGSIVRGDVVASSSADARFMAKRQKLIDEGKLKVRSDGNYDVVENVVLTSPSLAATLVLGRSSNGWLTWATDDGQTLDQLYRAKETVASE